jgi:hypothetical protein
LGVVSFETRGAEIAERRVEPPMINLVEEAGKIGFASEDHGR